ncbi:NAD(P)H-dependent oxidoreductase [Anaerobacillus sp. CMMVII]|uniref:NADPH-dependent FMN reductase n=1 Tax=Anaerobacillus sp. CMMVII TaxID=2755588 RepID=UPI0021B81BBA|nr:NADPH-dependent FMN reductase [Anaerobacillus sp. CMMVII]MCT8139285.1 NAD(P)H-dependent oxidoreductase [Anaerobacillus sp. CMMVII]
MKLVIISGSPRSFGRTKIVGAFISNKYGIEMFDLSKGTIPLYNGTAEQYEFAAVKEIRALVKESDGIIIATPEYHNGISGSLKNTLDFLGSEQFFNKPVAMLAVAGGGKGGINALNNLRIVLRGLYANVIPKQIVLDPENFDRENETLSKESALLVDEQIDQLKLYAKAWSYLKQEHSVS